MKKTALILVLGAAMTMFGCGDDKAAAGGSPGNGGSGGSGGDTGGGGDGGDGGDTGTGGGGGGPAGGSTTWQATTTPPGGGNVPPTTGGCEIEVTSLMVTIALDVSITLDASWDADAGELTTGYTLAATNPLLGALANAAEYTDLNIDTATNGTPATVLNVANPAVTGMPIGAFVEGSTLTFETPDAILANTEAVTPGVDPMEVNFAGTFDLLLTAAGIELGVDETICTFDVEGDPIVF